MLKRLLAIAALTTLAVVAIPAGASAATYVPGDNPPKTVTGTVVPPDGGSIGSREGGYVGDDGYVGDIDEAYVGYVGIASAGYDIPMPLIVGGSAALLLGLTLATTSVVRRKRAGA
ncbi:hypothetical protein [Cryobacterium sp. Y11]|uniref:hypothetical protein n=1 Tax=Cryobacterium sp. Y11 TaxID=2045016 RepID=UPI000CE323B9|nr:hypothetical protein [Cryobacterium sp. Y11]